MHVVLYFKFDRKNDRTRPQCRICEREHSRKLRQIKKNLTLKPRIPARKHCTRCKCWRQNNEFYVKDKDRNNTPITLQTVCKTCQRVDGRIRNGIRERGKPYQKRSLPEHGGMPGSKTYDHERYRQRQRERQRERRCNMTKEQRERIRRRQRERATLKRRQEGAAVRGPWKKYRHLINDRTTVPVEPFRDWLHDYAKFNEVEQLARLAEVDSRRFRVLFSGEYDKKGKKYPVKNVSLDFVDKCLLAAGNNTHISDLYPDL